MTTVRGGNVLFENDGHGHFKDISKAAGVDYVGHSSGAVFFDYDNDGLLDLYLCNVGKYTTDVKGRGGAYEGLEDAFFGHLHMDRSESAHSVQEHGRQPVQERHRRKSGWAMPAGAATRASPT